MNRIYKSILKSRSLENPPRRVGIATSRQRRGFGMIGLRGVPQAAALHLVVCFGGSSVALAQEEEEAKAVSFEEACEWLEADRFEDASQAFGEVMSLMIESGASSSEIAAAAFNQGLSNYFQAESLRELSPREALATASYSRDAFLQATRERQGFRRASMRLDALAGMVEELMALVEEEEEKEQEQEAAIEALLERIQALLDAQLELKVMVTESDVDRRPINRRPATVAQETEKEPLNVDRRSIEFENQQLNLVEEGHSIQETMIEMDESFSLADEALENLPVPEVESIMKRPLELMDQAIDAQKDAAELLPQWQYWPSARSRQTVAAERLQEIIDMFASNSDSEGEGEWEEEEWDDYSEGEDGEGISSSLPMQGDFRKDAMMQPLPVPSFSAEEVLMEEMGSQQFRQQQRAKANAGKVEKDW